MRSEQQLKQELLEVLTQIRDNGPMDPKKSICGNVDCILGVHAWYISMQLVREWPLSISDSFPIEGSHLEFLQPGKWDGERGWRRRALLDWMIEELQKELNT